MHTLRYFLKTPHFKSFHILLQDKEVLRRSSSNVKEIVLNMSNWEKATWNLKMIFFIALVSIVPLEESGRRGVCKICTCLSYWVSFLMFSYGEARRQWLQHMLARANVIAGRKRKKSLIQCVWWCLRMILKWYLRMNAWQIWDKIYFNDLFLL